MTEITLMSPGGATASKQDEIISALSSLIAEIAAGSGPVALDSATLAALESITVSGTVSLSSATLTALENIIVTGTVDLGPDTLAALGNVSATIDNFPTDFPDTATHTALAGIQSALESTLTVGGEVAISSGSLGALEAALEFITVAIDSGQVVGLDAATLAALENIVVSGTVDLGASTLAALENISVVVSNTVAVSGTVNVGNLPSSYPLPSAQVADLKVVTAKITDESGVPFTADNPMPVDVGGSISIDSLTVSYQSVESTAQVPDHLLVADEEFTGPWEDVRDFAAISIAVWTDAGSAVNGALLEFSEDGINPVTSQASTVPGGISAWFSVAPQARYVRVKYTNGPADMTILKMSVIFSFQPLGVTQAPLGGPLTDGNVVQSTKAAMVGRIGSGPYAGLWTPIAIDPATGRLLTTGTAVTDEQLRATPLPVSGTVDVTQPVAVEDSGEREYTHHVQTVTASGDTTLITPASGKRLRLRWLYAIADANVSSPLINVSLGSEDLYRVYALSKRQVKTGAVDAPLVMNLSTTGSVAVTVIYEEID